MQFFIGCFTIACNIQQFLFDSIAECNEIYTIRPFFFSRPRIPFDIPNHIPFNRRTDSPIWMRCQSSCRVNFPNLFFTSTGCRANFWNLFLHPATCRANIPNLFLYPATCRANVPNPFFTFTGCRANIPILKHPIAACKVAFPIRFWLLQLVKWLFRF